MMIPSRPALLLAALAGRALAQVTTACQPLNRTDCPGDPALGTDYTVHFNASPPAAVWETTAGTVNYDATNGAVFTVARQGDSPTLRSKFYFFFGRVEVMMKTAPGAGIVSSVMLLSDDLDEIDLEFLGGNTTHGETNYFGKGLQDFENAIYYPVNSGGKGPQEAFHNYTLDWTADRLQYWFDGQLVRTLAYAAADKGTTFPQTPMRLSLGIWAGGDPSLPQGTRDWAGGTTDYDKGPYNMYVQSTRVVDYSSGKQYTYGDKTGSHQSIVVQSGNSTVKQAIEAPPSESLSEKFNDLPQGAKVGVYVGAGIAAAALFGAGLAYFIKQRRRGAREAKLAEEREKSERVEMERYRREGVDPDAFADGAAAAEYKAPSRVDAYRAPGTPVDEPPLNVWDPTSGMSTTRQPPMHSFSTPTPPMRRGSPAPSVNPFADVPRVSSPGPMGPMRSFSSGTSGGYR